MSPYLDQALIEAHDGPKKDVAAAGADGLARCAWNRYSHILKSFRYWMDSDTRKHMHAAAESAHFCDPDLASVISRKITERDRVLAQGVVGWAWSLGHHLDRLGVPEETRDNLLDEGNVLQCVADAPVDKTRWFGPDDEDRLAAYFGIATR